MNSCPIIVSGGDDYQSSSTPSITSEVEITADKHVAVSPGFLPFLYSFNFVLFSRPWFPCHLVFVYP